MLELELELEVEGLQQQVYSVQLDSELEELGQQEYSVELGVQEELDSLMHQGHLDQVAFIYE